MSITNDGLIITHYNEAGEVHRDDDEPALLIPSMNTYQYYTNGNLHRANGPAIITNQYCAWYAHGLPHRIGGPAVYNIGEEHRGQKWVHGRYMGEWFTRQCDSE